MFEDSLLGARWRRRVSFSLTAALAAAGALSASANVTVVQGPSIAEFAEQAGIEANVTARAPQADPKMIHAMVQFHGPSAAEVYAQSLTSLGEVAAKAAAADRVLELDRLHSTMAPLLESATIGANELYRSSRAYNGIAIQVEAHKLNRIARLPQVKAVHRMREMQRSAESSLSFLGVDAVWTSLGLDGSGVSVGIVDSGIDYLHANFGGPGTEDAYLAVDGVTPDPSYFPNAKVVGGFDFAGDAYNASTGMTTPAPDPDPLDCGGHGTGVASLVGGYGMNADGTTYTGPYDDTADFGSLGIAPGMAPGSELYGLRVFGCAGGTFLVGQAIEWSMDPNDDGDMSDRLDVLNLSLGSDIGVADDPEAVMLDNATLLGMVVVAAAGNAGNTYFNTSAPGSTNRVLTLAASLNEDFKYSRVIVESPASIAAPYWAAEGVISRPLGDTTLTGTVVYAEPALADLPLTNAAEIAGNIALIDRGAVAFVTKMQNAFDAGAIGVIVVNNQPGAAPIVMGGTGYIDIPGVMISFEDGETIKAELANGVSATLASDVPGSDIIADYSSRGPRYSDLKLKPELTAPAERVLVANTTTGTGARTFNGTSSATPHTAGVMALLRQKYPDWSVEHLKAAAVSTAVHNVRDSIFDETLLSGAGRVGSGRLDAYAALNTDVIAYALNNPGLINSSFGLVEATEPVTAYDGILLTNSSDDTSYTFDIAYVPHNDVPGVSYSFPLGSTVTVPPLSNGWVLVQMDFDPAVFGNFWELSVPTTQLGLPRQWLAEAEGWLEFTPQGEEGMPLRLAIHSAPRPSSDVYGDIAELEFTSPSGFLSVPLMGDLVNTGAPPLGIVSMSKAMELQFQSANEPESEGYENASDLYAVGVSSDYWVTDDGGDPGEPTIANTTLSFGVATHGDFAFSYWWAASQRILIDVDEDGTDDYLVYSGPLDDGPDPTNVYITWVWDLIGDPNGASIPGYYFTNGLTSFDADTYLFQNNVVMFPVPAFALGLTDDNSDFNYYVQTYYGGELIDESTVLTYDAAAPGLDTVGLEAGEPFLVFHEEGTELPVFYDAPAFLANNSQGLMLMHFHNEAGNRVQLIELERPRITGIAPESGAVGDTVTITGENLGTVTNVRFYFNRRAAFTVIDENTIEVVVPRRARTGSIVIDTPLGQISSGRLRFTVTE